MDIQIEIQYFPKYISKYSTHSTLVDASAWLALRMHFVTHNSTRTRSIPQMIRLSVSRLALWQHA